MSRLVKHAAQSPAKHTTPKGDDIYICRCGLSKDEKGLCDGSHQKTQGEDAGKVYSYDDALERKEVSSTV